MMCAWQELLNVLPTWMRERTDSLGRGRLQELRLRLDRPPELIIGTERRSLDKPATQSDLTFVINAASKYSPWAAETVSKGFLTVTGGHRIGICGEAVGQGSAFKGLRDFHSLCIRIAADHKGIAGVLRSLQGNILIIGPPGSGKTTLLRDLIRELSKKENVGVIDQRWEIFPAGFDPGIRTDILFGCDKAKAADMLLRTMAPDTIAMDEITEMRDLEAIRQASYCGVKLLATVHAENREGLIRRPLYRELLALEVFSRFVTVENHAGERRYTVTDEEGALCCG